MSSEKISDEALEDLIYNYHFGDGSSSEITMAFKELQSSRRKIKQCEEALENITGINSLNNITEAIDIANEALAALRSEDK